MTMCAIKPDGRKQLFVASCVYLGQILLCFCMAWPSTNLFEDPNRTPLPDTVSLFQCILIETIFYIGVVIGACIFGLISNSTGRKPCFLISGVLCFCACLLFGQVHSSMVVVYIGKFFAGLGSGIAYVSILVYLGEIASTNIRGLLLTTTNIFRYTQNWFDLATFDAVPYSMMTYYGLVVSVAFIVAVYFIPESPVFFIMKGSKENLEKSLKSLGREKELEAMITTKATLQSLKKTQKDNWSEIFKVKSNRKALIITLCLNLLQCLSGAVSVVYFLPKFVYPNPHVPVDIVFIVVIASSTAGAVFSIFLVETIGRKTLLMISTGSCGISLGFLSTYLFVNIWMFDHTVWSWMLLVIIINYFFSFSMGFRIIPEILIGEMFTPNVRSTGAAFVIITSTLFDYSLNILADIFLNIAALNAQIGVLFVVYCLTNLSAFIFTLFLVPETKGLTFIEINEMLSKKKFIRWS